MAENGTELFRSRIFISYRHGGSDDVVGRLADDLRRHFVADKQVFQDIASIDPGVRFEDALRQGLESCAAVLVVIGPGWLDAMDDKGRRRLDLPKDWVTREIAESLKRPGVRVFPVLVGDAGMPGAEDLPEPLQALPELQAFPLTPRHWSNDVATLVEHLRRVPGLGRPATSWKRVAGIGAATAVALIAAYAAVTTGPDPHRAPVPVPMPQPAIEIKPAPAPAPGPHQETRPAPEPAPRAQPEIEIKPAPAPAAKPPQEAKPAPAPATTAQAEIETKPAPAPVAKPQQEAKPAPAPAAKPQQQAKPAPVPATRPQAEIEIGRAPVPAAKPEQEAKPVPAPAPPQVGARPVPPATAPPKASPAGNTFRDCPQCPEMVMIRAGSFEMGSPEPQSGREGPKHKVTIQRPFAVGKHEVTFDEWDACVAARACKRKPEDKNWGRGEQPVINVSWDDAREYVSWLKQTTGKEYRLLTEAEWEYAARAGTTTRYPWGNDPGGNQANFRDSGSQWSGKQTAPVRSFPANPFGLHDMIGNVWEWTQDCWNDSYGGAPVDGSAWESGDCGRRVVRGGSWFNEPEGARAAGRERLVPGSRNYILGFRVAKTL